MRLFGCTGIPSLVVMCSVDAAVLIKHSLRRITSEEPKAKY